MASDPRDVAAPRRPGPVGGPQLTEGARLPPHDPLAERAVLGAAILRPDIVPELAAILRDDDWYLPAHQALWYVICDRVATGRTVGVIALAHEIGKHRTLKGLGGQLYISDLANDPNVIPSQATWHARIIATCADQRRAIELGTWLVQAGHGATDHDAIRQRLECHLADHQMADRSYRIPPNVDDLLAGDDAEYDWLIPGLLERGDRVILTGPEGGGKSTFLRQVAVMGAAGLHPFTGEPIEPFTVLTLDLENSRRQIRRKIRPLRMQAGDRLDPDRLLMEVRTEGIDLTKAEDMTWLFEMARAAKPDLLITGPVYKMANGDPTEEKAAKPVAMALDRLRAQVGCAVLIEAHTAKSPSGQRRRPKEPYGWSGWMRWPEFGIHLDADGGIDHWRGQRDERDWPSRLTRDGEWPWTPVTDENAQRWQRIKSSREDRDQRMTLRDVHEATGMSLAMVQRLVGRGARYAHEWAVLNVPPDTEGAGEWPDAVSPVPPSIEGAGYRV